MSWILIEYVCASCIGACRTTFDLYLAYAEAMKGNRWRQSESRELSILTIVQLFQVVQAYGLCIECSRLLPSNAGLV